MLSWSLILVGLELCESFDVYLGPEWKSFAQWKDGPGVVTGSLSTQVAYEIDTSSSSGRLPIVEDLRDTLEASNFFGGSSGRIKQGTFVSTKGNISRHTEVIVFVGDFQLSLEATCMPFDSQTMFFDLKYPAPTNNVLNLQLMCGSSRRGKTCRELDDEGNEIHTRGGHPAVKYRDKKVRKTVDSFWSGVSAKGFGWSEMTCELIIPEDEHEERHVKCTMSGHRESLRQLLIHMLPGFVMILIGYGSFLIPINLAMPRIATSMIALLTFTGKSTSVLLDMPSNGFSYTQEFYVLGLFSMLCNVIGHILCLKFAGLHRFLDQMNIYIMFFAFLLALTITLHVRSCTDHVPSASTAVAIVIISIVLLASFAIVLRNNWKEVRSCHSRIKHNIQKSVSRIESSAGEEHTEDCPQI